MSKLIRTGALGLGLACATLAIPPDPFAEAATRPPYPCRDQIEDTFGDELETVIDHRVELATNEKNATIEGLDEIARQPQPLGSVTIESYLANNPTQTSTYILDRSGIELVVTSDLPWIIDPELLESTYEYALRRNSENDQYLDETAECYADQIFGTKDFDGLSAPYLLLGNDLRLTSRNRVAPRALTSSTYVGLESRGNALVLPGIEDDGADAAVTIIHELQHLVDGDAGVKHRIPDFREYLPNEIEPAAREYVSDNGSFLTLDSES